MSTTSRRQFLQQLLVAASGIAFPAVDAIAQSKNLGDQFDLKLSRWVDPLPIPKTLSPIRRTRSRTEYRVRMLEFSKQLHSELPPAKLWGYEGRYPGPIIVTERGEPIEIRWENQLPTRHIFEVDP